VIQVLLVDPHDLVLTGIKSLLSGVQNIQVIGQATHGAQALQLVRIHRPDVVLTEVHLPGISGIEMTQRLLYSAPEIKIMALTSCEQTPFPSQMLKAGAKGYLTKKSNVQELTQAIKQIYQGCTYITPHIAQQLNVEPKNDGKDAILESLSSRELQVMLMITSGQKVQAISDELCVSPKTVCSYRYRLFDKLSVQSDVALTHLAIRYGLTGLSGLSPLAENAL